MRIAAMVVCSVVVLAMPAMAQGRDDDADQVKVRRLDAAERAADLVAPVGRAALPSGCITTLPTSPPADAVTQSASGQSWLPSGGWSQNYTIKWWRQACANDSTKSAVLLRYSFPSLRVFACSVPISVVQNGRTYSSFRMRTSGTSSQSWCDYIYTDQTFVLDQWTIYDNFDEQGTFTVNITDVGYTIPAVTVPAYSAPSTPTTPTPTTPSTGLVPVTGWWWNAAQAGRGFGIGTNGADRIFLGGFFYSSATGSPATWAVATMTRASSGSNSFAGTLQYCTGGQALEATTTATPTCTAGGDAMLTLSSTQAGRLTITRPFGITTIDLVPFNTF